MSPEPLLPPEPLAHYQALAARLRRELLRLADLYGTNNPHRVLTAAQRALSRFEPELANTIHGGQLLAWLAAARKAAGDRPPRGGFPPPLPLPPRFGRFGDDPRAGPIFPQVLKAAEWVRTRLPFTQGEFDQLDADAARVGFTVARVQSLETVEAVQRAIVKDVERGGTLAEFRKDVGGQLNRAGLHPNQVEALYRTYVGRAYASGQRAVLDSPGLAGAFPYMRYSATHDSRTRPEHLALERMGLDGTDCYRADDPFWQLYTPPWAWNCRCHAFPVSVRDAARRGVREAREWLETGIAPAVPEWVDLSAGFPPLPRGWVPSGGRLAAVG